jgi:hypothetical protein
VRSHCPAAQLIRDLMDDAVATGLNLVRFFALPVDTQYALQSAPGQFNEAAFRGLDYALECARARGIKVRPSGALSTLFAPSRFAES